MLIERPDSEELTPEETLELENLKSLIESSIEDGFLSRIEYQRLKDVVLNEIRGQPEQLKRKLDLYRQIVAEKVRNGEVILETPQ